MLHLCFLALAVHVNLSGHPTRVLGVGIYSDPELKGGGFAIAYESRLTSGDGALRFLNRRKPMFEQAALVALTTIRLRLGVLKWHLKAGELKKTCEKAPQANPWLNNRQHDVELQVELQVAPSVICVGGASGG